MRYADITLKEGASGLLSILDYGNEVESGQGVARAIKEGIVKREELFIVSKLWNSFHDKERVEPICKKQLQDWGIDYFDLYIVHFPISLKYVDPSVRYPPGFTYDGKELVPGKATIQETWTAMESVAEKGLAKSIGISNFNGQLIMDLLRYAKIVPATLQIEHHPYLTQPGLVQLAQSNGIAVTAYSSFGPQSFLELDMKRAKDTPLLLEHPTIKKITEKHGKTPAQILLRWATQRNIAVIPKSNNQGRLAQNLDVESFNLDKAELDEISGLDKGLRFNDPLNVSMQSLHIRYFLTLFSTAFPNPSMCKPGKRQSLGSIRRVTFISLAPKPTILAFAALAPLGSFEGKRSVHTSLRNDCGIEIKILELRFKPIQKIHIAFAKLGFEISRASKLPEIS